MKYKFLANTLKIFVYGKRAIWWVGSKLGKLVGGALGKLWHVVAYIRYKFGFKLRKAGLGQKSSWFTTRFFFQFLSLIILLGAAYPQTRFFVVQEIGYNWQYIKLYNLTAQEVGDTPATEVEVESGSYVPQSSTSWQQGVVQHAGGVNSGGSSSQDTVVLAAGGDMMVNPILMPGGQLRTRIGVENYTVAVGDTIPHIAAAFGVSVETILWENNLSAKDIIRPGKVLSIPPVSGVMHTVAKGDTVKKIADMYKVGSQDIIAFNKLTADGGGLVTGARIMVPQGKKPAPITPPTVVAVKPSTSRSAVRGVLGAALPTGSPGAVQASGYIWPTTAWIIVRGLQISPYHTGVDIATNNGSAFGRPTFAAKDGIVIWAGWSNGYGNLIKIDHGNGYETYYGHHSQILVSVGEHVTQGQIIGAIGSTGNSTGPHLHFEIRYNGKILNPLDYVRPPASHN